MLILKQFHVAEKVKNVSKFSTLDNKEKHLEPRTWCIRTPVSARNRLDFCRGSKYLDDRFHEVSNHTQVNTGRSKIAEKESKEQPNLDSCLYHHCLSTTTHELDWKSNFLKFLGRFNPKSGQLRTKFSTKKIKKIESKLAISTLHWLAPLTGIIQMTTIKTFLYKSSRLQRSHKVVNFDGNFQSEKFKNQPPKKGKNAFQLCPQDISGRKPNTYVAATDLRKVSNYNLADPAFDNWSPAWTIHLHTHCEVTECQGRNYNANRHDP